MIRQSTRHKGPDVVSPSYLIAAVPLLMTETSELDDRWVIRYGVHNLQGHVM
jgi:hypothetical protein